MDNFRDSYFQVDWDLTSKRLKGTYWGKQYDTGRGFAVTVINGGQVVAPTTEVLRLKWEKPDNTTGYVNATIVNGKFIIENIDQMFTVHGSVRADFELSVGGEFVASITFYVNVEKAVAVDAIESSSDFTALQDALADVGDMQAQVDAVIANATVDSEVILARGTEPTLGARLDSTDAQLAEIEQEVNTGVENVLANGDFSNGTTDWTYSTIPISVVNGNLVGRATAVGQFVRSNALTFPSGNTIYVKARFKATSSFVELRDGLGLVSAPHPGSGEFEDVSFLKVSDGTSWHIRIMERRASGWDDIEIESVVAIDITGLFNGRTPTAKEMDRFLSINGGYISGKYKMKNLIMANYENEEAYKANAELALSEQSKINDKLLRTIERFGEIETKTTGINPIMPEKSTITVLHDGTTSGVTSSNGVMTQDANYAKIGSAGAKIVYSAAVTGAITKTIPEAAQIEKYNTVGLWLYLDDASKVSALNVRVYNASEQYVQYTLPHLTVDGKALVNGWNLLRWQATKPATFATFTGKIAKIMLLPVITAATFIAIGGVWLESFEKAKILLIHDGGYNSFFTKGMRGYYDLEARGIPCTIATIPNKIFNADADPLDKFISPSKLYELSISNNNDISIHSWDGEDALATMTEAEVRDECFKAIDLLRKNGYNPLWRAAWFRNNVPGATGAKGLFNAFAMFGGLSVVEVIESYPFPTRYNVNRVTISEKTNTQIDDVFAKLKKTNGVLVCYLHWVENVTGQMSEANWDYFLSKIDTAKAEGWLEGTTYKLLSQPYQRTNV